LVIQPVVTYINGKAEAHLSDIAVYALSINATWLNAVTFIYTVNANKLANTSKTNMSDALKGITGFEEGELRSGYTDFHARFWCSFSLWGGGIRVYVDGILASMPTGRGKLLILISTFLKIEVLSRLFFSLYGNSSGGTVLATTGEGKPSVSLGFNTGHFSKQ
jgi:hypothetical protein